MTTDVLDKSNDIQQNQMNKSAACSHHGHNSGNPSSASSSACTDVCKLCLYTGGGNVMFDSIIAFVVEKSSEIHFDVLIAQVQAELRDKCDLYMDHEEIKNHFLLHNCNQKVVLNHILRDLVDLASTAKKQCVIRNEETMQAQIDAKNIAVYLDISKEIKTLYRHLDSCAKQGRQN